MAKGLKSKKQPFQWKPFSSKQMKLATWWTPKSPYATYDTIIFDGAIRSGKTVTGIDSFLNWSLSKYSGANFILGGKSMGALKRNVLEPMFQILTAKGIDYDYHRSENYIVIGTNTYYCFGANNEASQDVLQGLTAAGAFLDEAALMPRSFVEQAIGRCSLADDEGEPGKVWMNCNPGGPYHYLKTEYIDKRREKKILRLHFTMDDNPALSEKVKARYARQFSGVFKKRYIEGLWVMAEGLIYDMFDESRHRVEKVPKCDYYWAACDYGTFNPTVFLLFGRKNGKTYVIKEYYYDGRSGGDPDNPEQGEGQRTDEEYSKDLRKFLRGYKVKHIYIDPSAASFITQVRKDNTKYREKGQPQKAVKVIKANNSVIDGIRFVAKELGNDCLVIHNSCVNLFKEVSSYVWDEKHSLKTGEDRPLKEKDHCMDALRYGVYNEIGLNNQVVVNEPGKLDYQEVLNNPPELLEMDEDLLYEFAIAGVNRVGPGM